MRNLSCIVLTAFISVACESEKKATVNLISKDLASSHPEWEVSKDTISKDIQIGFQDFEIPARISIVAARDADSCLRIGSFQLVRLESDENVKVFNLSTDFVPCGTNLGSDDERRSETMIVNGEFSANEGIKQQKFEGTIFRINGIGEYQSISLDK